MQYLEVSGAVRHIYIYVIRQLKVNCLRIHFFPNRSWYLSSLPCGAYSPFLLSRSEQHPVHSSCKCLQLRTKSDKIFTDDYFSIYFIKSKYQWVHTVFDFLLFPNTAVLSGMAFMSPTICTLSQRLLCWWFALITYMLDICSVASFHLTFHIVHQFIYVVLFPHYHIH